ncbi:MAG: hypothetical protein J6X45_03280, partial [Lachnospiraceae bacterium]|nr:hypothetical protein [Lachnospiraceae bacterium]
MASNKIRMSGMVSGMDTESLITALTSAHKTKVDNAKGEQKKLSWKQDAWKTMNSKIYGLFSGKLSNMRFSTAYNKKVTTSSNSALSVVAGDGAAEGSMTAKVKSLAKSGYITGAEITTSDGGKITQDTKVTELGIIPEDWGICKIKKAIQHLETGVSVNSSEQLVAAGRYILKTSCVH